MTSPPSRRSFARRSPSTVPASRNLRRKRSPRRHPLLHQNPMTEFIAIRGARENNLKDVSLADSQAQDHDLHRRLGLGEIVDRVRHDRDGGAAPALRELLAVHPQLPAEVPAARRRRDREPQHGGDRRPEAARRRIALHRRHGHRHLHACCACCSRASGKPSAGGAIAYSFNDPQGMCPECGGLGKKVGVVSDDFLDMSKSLNEGAVQVPFFGDWDAQAYTLSGFFDNDKKLSKFTQGRDGPAAARQGQEVQGEVRRAAPSTSPTSASSRRSSARTSSATSRRSASARRKR